MNIAMQPKDWPDKWAGYEWRNERCRREHDRLTRNRMLPLRQWSRPQLRWWYANAFAPPRREVHRAPATKAEPTRGEWEPQLNSAARPRLGRRGTGLLTPTGEGLMP